MKTIVYIDGFNFYYGLLKNSPHKWLDLVKLFEDHLLPIHSPEAELVKLKLFTVPILPKFATNKEKAQNSQDRYLNALNKVHPDKVEVIKGYYSATKQNAMKYISPPDKAERVDIWKLEEKLTDVQMALHIYRDAVKENCEQIVLVTNDSDIEPAAQLVKEDTNIILGVVIPRKFDTARSTSTKLRDISDWALIGVKDGQLASSQFPRSIPTKKKPIIKPDYW